MKTVSIPVQVPDWAVYRGDINPNWRETLMEVE